MNITGDYYLVAWRLVAEREPRLWNLVIRALPQLWRQIGDAAELMEKRWRTTGRVGNYVIHRLDGEIHSVGNDPAVTYDEGTVSIYLHMNYGRLHRTDGGAAVDVCDNPADYRDNVWVLGFYESGKLVNKSAEEGALFVDAFSRSYRFWANSAGEVVKIRYLERCNVHRMMMSEVREYFVDEGKCIYYISPETDLSDDDDKACSYVMTGEKSVEKEWRIDRGYLATAMDSITAAVSGLFPSADNMSLVLCRFINSISD